jgi:hypothetical protein
MALTVKEKFSSRTREILQGDEALFQRLKREHKSICNEAFRNFQTSWNESRQRISIFIKKLGSVYMTADQKAALLPDATYSDDRAQLLCNLLQDVINGSVLIEHLPLDMLWTIVRELDWKSVNNLYRAFIQHPRMRLILGRFILQQDVPLLEYPMTKVDSQLTLIARTLFWTAVTSFSQVRVLFVGKTLKEDDDEEINVEIFNFSQYFPTETVARPDRKLSKTPYFALTTSLSYISKWVPNGFIDFQKVVDSASHAVYGKSFFSNGFWIFPIGDPVSYSFIIRILQGILQWTRDTVASLQGKKMTIACRLKFEQGDSLSFNAHLPRPSPVFPLLKYILSEYELDAWPTFIDLPTLTLSTMDAIDQKTVEFFSEKVRKTRYHQDLVEIPLFLFDHYRSLKMIDSLSNFEESEQRLRTSQVISTFPRTRLLFGLPRNMCLTPINLPANPMVDMPDILNIWRLLYYYHRYGKHRDFGSETESRGDYVIF